MVIWKPQIVNIFVFSVEEVVYRERVGFVHMLRTINRLKHRTNNDVGVDHGDVENWLLRGQKVPCGLFGKLLGNIVSKNWVLSFDCFSFCDLES